MRPIPLMRPPVLRPYVELVERAGSDLAPLRDRWYAAVAEPHGLIPLAHAASLVDQSARALGAESLALRLGSDTPVTRLEGWNALLAAAPSVGGFLQRAIGASGRFNSGYRLWTVRRGDAVWLHIRYTRSLRHARAHVLDYTIALWISAFRSMLAPDWRATELHLEGDPPRHAEALANLARRICFREPCLAIVFPRWILAQPVAGPRATGTELVGPDPARDFAASVRQAVASLMRLGDVRVATAAEVAGESQRTFQRHLAEAGLSFSKLVDEARFDAARDLLADPGLRVVDVAAALGYGDAANFTRAFRRWSGVPPQDFRRAGSARLDLVE